VPVNQQFAPVGFPDAGSTWQQLGQTFFITSSTLSVRLTNAANGVVIADAIRVERINNLAVGPEIQVLQQATSTDVADGGAVDFGSTFANLPVERTFVVRNVGTANLAVSPFGAAPAGFTIVSDIPPATVLAPGGSVNFIVRFNATASSSGSLSTTTNDSDENPFNFTVSGTVASVRFFDNGDSVFSTVGTWESTSGQGFQDDVHFSAAGTGSDVATWSIPVSPGQYRVAVTWAPHPNRATDAPFTVLNGAVPLTTVLVNQQIAPPGTGPDGVTDAGTAWRFLGGTHSITGSTLVVRLTDGANGFVIADGVRVERVGDLPPGPDSAEPSSADAVFEDTEAAPLNSASADDELLLVAQAVRRAQFDAPAAADLLFAALPERSGAELARRNSAGEVPGTLDVPLLEPRLVDAALASDAA
jgi:hypothetical protein